MSNRPPQYLQGRREALKWAVTWLYAHAESMNDPHARAILNSAAYGMGQDVRDGAFPKVRHPTDARLQASSKPASSQP